MWTFHCWNVPFYSTSPITNCKSYDTVTCFRAAAKNGLSHSASARAPRKPHQCWNIDGRSSVGEGMGVFLNGGKQRWGEGCRRWLLVANTQFRSYIPSSILQCPYQFFNNWQGRVVRVIYSDLVTCPTNGFSICYISEAAFSSMVEDEIGWHI